MADNERGVRAELQRAQQRIEELEADRARLQGLFDGVLARLPLILFRLDGNGTVSEALGSGLSRLGVSREELVGRHAFEAYPQAREGLEGALAGGSSVFETEGRSPSGEPWCFLTYTFFDAPAGSGAVGFAIDITEQTLARQRLAKREAELRSLLAQAPDYIMRLDRDGIVRFINYTRAGVTPEQVLGTHVLEYIAPANHRHMREAVKAVLSKGEQRQLETIGRDPAGREDNYLVRISPIREDDEIAGAVFVATNITSRKEAEKREAQILSQLQQGQKLESLGMLAGGIAHDFNNLLMGILGNASLALDEMPTSAPGIRRLHDIEQASKRAAELCQQLLAYSGKGRFVVRPVDLAEVVESTARLLEVSVPKLIHLAFDCPAGVGAVQADVTQLRQIIMNLVVNAAEAIGERRGTITIRTGCLECDSQYLTDTFLDDDLTPGTYCYLEVSDNGRGMDADTRQQLFDPFFTTKKTGRGLGMAAVLGIVRGHQGAVKVYSEIGRGTTVKVLLPRSSEPAQQIDSIQAPSAALHGSGTVLVVDDEPMVRRVAAEVLQAVGFHVLTAEDGEVALETFATVKDQVVAVLLDLTMPKLSGEEVFRELRRIAPDVCVVLSSGYNEQETTSRFAGKGLAGFIQKPYSARELQQIVLDALAQRRERTPGAD